MVLLYPSVLHAATAKREFLEGLLQEAHAKVLLWGLAPMPSSLLF